MQITGFWQEAGFLYVASGNGPPVLHMPKRLVPIQKAGTIRIGAHPNRRFGFHLMICMFTSAAFPAFTLVTFAAATRLSTWRT